MRIFTSSRFLPQNEQCSVDFAISIAWIAAKINQLGFRSTIKHL
jgi:hypothetical protein